MGALSQHTLRTLSWLICEDLWVFLVGEKQEGSLLKVSFDKRVRIDLLVPLPVSTPPPTLPTPFPFSLIFHRKPTPPPPTRTRPQTPLPGTPVRIRTPLRKLPCTRKNYPLVSAQP